LEEDRSGVVVGRTVSKGATNASKLGESTGVPNGRVGIDTGEVEMICIKAS
jgi:hypothetical protein